MTELYVIQNLISLLKDYEKEENVTATEFIENRIVQNSKITTKKQEIYQYFLLLMKHEEFFFDLACNFYRTSMLKPLNREAITIIIFILIFLLEEDNCNDFLHALIQTKIQNILEVLQYFTEEDNLIDTVLIGTKYYENDYVLENILNPLLKKSNILVSLQGFLRENLQNMKKITKKPPTKTCGPSMLNRRKLIPPRPPINTPIINRYKIKALSVPKSTYVADVKNRERLQEIYNTNRENAKKLYTEAQNNAFNCANIQSLRADNSDNNINYPLFKAKKAPAITSNVEIKKNAASLMREAALCYKEQKEEIEKIENLTVAVFDPLDLEKLEEEVRTCKEQERLQYIEMRHLEGQLSYEEAILAKKELLKTNKENVLEFKKEKEKFLHDLERWRIEEQNRIKEQVEKCQSVLKNAREARKEMEDRKRGRAKMVDEESREIKKEIYLKREKELNERIELIRELRALQQVHNRILHRPKRFDPSETSNLGLLCEMSIAELRERLALTKTRMRIELDERKKIIRENRETQKKLLESIKKFIACRKERVQGKTERKKIVVELQENSRLVALRERLRKTKESRMNS